MTRLLVGSVFVVSTYAGFVGKYALLNRIDMGGNGKVYTAKSPSGEEVVLKCGPANAVTKYEAEFATMLTLGAKNWSVTPIESFMNGDSPCIVMEQLGDDLSRIRGTSTGVWPIATVASIGVGIIDALIDLHFDFKLTHSDMHPANIAVRKNDSSKLVVFDYGDMKPAPSPIRGRTDLKDAVLSLRYYLDGNRRYYVAKQYSYNKTELCEGIPDDLCNAIDIVYSAGRKELTRDDYMRIRSLLEGLMGQKYDGKIIWGSITPKALPKGEKKPVDPSKNSPPSPQKENKSSTPVILNVGDAPSTTSTTTKSGIIPSCSMTLLAVLVSIII
jgi:hypothetical protein